jgi:lysophospholipase L1-like esterase
MSTKKSLFAWMFLFLWSGISLLHAIPLTVYNKGIKGNNTNEGKARFIQDVIDFHPRYVLIFFGANDALNEAKFVPLDRFTDNLNWMVDQAQAASIKPVLCTVHACNEKELIKRHPASLFGTEGPNGKLKHYNDAIRGVATAKSVSLADFAAQTKNAPPDLKWLGPDGLHLTPAGYKLLAQTFLDTLKPDLVSDQIVVCFGDSLTFGAFAKGQGTVEGETYPACLKTLARDMVK